MAFDSWPRKFATDCHRVSYGALYLSDIAMLWWQPILVAFPEPSIHNDWGEFVNQLNTYFGQPDLAQASEHTLLTLKMYDHQHVNKYMIEFSEHAMHTWWNDAALYGEFYWGFSECIKDQLWTNSLLPRVGSPPQLRSFPCCGKIMLITIFL